MTGMGPRAIVMRAPCVSCCCTDGVVIERNGQDTVRCVGCDKFQYNAPRTETGRAQRTNETVHAGIKAGQRSRILMRAMSRCERCGAHGPDTILHVGHILSVEYGLRFSVPDEELNHDENLMCLCESCNLGMGPEPMSLRVALSILRARISWLKQKGGAS